MLILYLMLKVFLVKIMVVAVASYEFGYHPSAEEDDQQQRETRKIWKFRQLLYDQTPSKRRPGEEVGSWSYKFVPRYDTERFRKHAQSPGYSENPAQQGNKWNDQQQEANSEMITFNMFSNEVVKDEEGIQHQENVLENTVNTVFSGTKLNTLPEPTLILKPNVTLFSPFKIRPMMKPVDPLIDLESGSSGPLKNPTIPILYNNLSSSQFPVLFENPATKIIYAITELGKLPGNTTLPNVSIPTFVTLQEHERVLLLLKKHYERSCRRKSPKNNIRKPHQNSSLDKKLPKPSGNLHHVENLTTIQADVRPTIMDPIKVPLIRRPTTKTKTENNTKASEIFQNNTKTKKRRRKKKRRKQNKKRPGFQYSRTATTTESSPRIVLGKRTSDPTRETPSRPATQLERPGSLPITIASNFRSYADLERELSEKAPTKQRTKRSNTKFQTEVENTFGTNDITEEGTKIYSTEEASKVTTKPTQKVAFIENLSTSAPEIINKSITKNLFDPIKSQKFNTHPSKILQEAFFRKVNSENFIQKRKNAKRKKESEDDYDYFGLIDYDEDEEGAEEDDDDSDEYYNEYRDEENRTKKKTKPNKYLNNIYKISHEQNAGVKISQDNSSSAESNADYGALPDVTNHRPIVSTEEDQDEEEEMHFGTENILRRKKGAHKPGSSTQVDDYYDDGAEGEEDEGSNSSGISGFLNMILHPIQVLMDKLFDNGIEDDVQSSMGPTGIYRDEGIQPEDKEGNSLMDWLGSWLGFSRRTTKKIGGSSSSTAVSSITTEKPSSGWLGSWLNRGNTPSTTVGSSFENPIEDHNDDADDGDNGYKWFFGWFDGAKKRQATKAPTTSATLIPQVPILTIVDPMRNPQNWIGILGNHIGSNITAPVKQPATSVEQPFVSRNPNRPPRKINYRKYQIWRLQPQDEDQVAALEEYKKSNGGAKLQWLKGPSLRGLNDVLVSPRLFADFEAALKFESIAHEVLIFDVGKVIDYESTHRRFHYDMDHSTSLHQPNGKKQKKTKKKKKRRKHTRKSSSYVNWSWNNYYEYNDIVKYLESVRLRYPQMIELLHIGRSYDGRPLIVVKIESKPALGSDASANVTTSAANRQQYKSAKKSGHTSNAVFIEAGTHGVEWIAPATATWMINELLRIIKSAKPNSIHDVIRNTTWYILPVLNPDGYVYTHEYDRFWKKSRSQHISRPEAGLFSAAMKWLQKHHKPPDKVCYGVDLDRNWRYRWGREGSSQTPCSEFYAGPVPFSEPETKALAQFLMDYRKQIKLFISLQAYGQVLSYPHSVNASSFLHADRVDDLLDLALVGTDNLRKRGSKSRYKIDSNGDIIEPRSGSADAFAAFEVGIPFSYTLQLGDNGVHGYLLPSSLIEATSRDAFEIITAMIEYI